MAMERTLGQVGGLLAQQLTKARKAAFLVAEQLGGRTALYLPTALNWMAALDAAASCIKQHESRFTAMETTWLWNQFALSRAYVDAIEGVSEPLRWVDWLKTEVGMKARARFPFDELARRVQESNRIEAVEHQLKAQTWANARAQRAARRTAQRMERHETKVQQALVRKRPSSTYSQPKPVNRPEILVTLTPAHAASTALRTSQADDRPTCFARQLQQTHGIVWKDKRPKGGAIWVEHFSDVDAISDMLRQEGFRYAQHRGWWRK